MTDPAAVTDPVAVVDGIADLRLTPRRHEVTLNGIDLVADETPAWLDDARTSGRADG